MRKLGRSAVAVLFAAALVACGTNGGPGGRPPAELRIGVLWPLSGANASQGLDVLHGAQLAAGIINESHPEIDLPLARGTGLPHLGNARVRLVTADTRSSAEIAAAEVDRLVDREGVAALVGCYQSGVTLAASERAERRRIPFVNGDSSSVSLTERGLSWFFRTGPTDDTFAESMFAYLDRQRQRGRSTRQVAVLHSDDQFGNDGGVVTARVAARHDSAVIADVPFDPASTDLAPQVARVQAANPDVLFVLAYTAPALALMRALNRAAWYPPALLAYGAGFADPAFRTALGPLADGVTTRAAWAAEIAERRPAASTVARLFQQRFHAPMTENSARSFTAVLALAQAIDSVRSTAPAAIRRGLRALDVPGDQTIMPWRGIAFDSHGQNTGADGVVEQMLAGRYRVVFPAGPGTAAPVWPMREAQPG